MILSKTNIALLAASLVTGACQQDLDPPSQSNHQTPTNLETVAAECIEVTEIVTVTGTVRPVQQATLNAQAAGTLQSLHAEPGTVVTAGDLLAEIDAAELKARVKRAQTEVDLSSRELARVIRLEEKSAATLQDLDQARAQADRAAAALEEAMVLETHTRILAPFSGTIVRKLVEIGDLAIPGRPLFEIEGFKGSRLEVSVAESVAPDITLGDQINVQIGNQVLNATVDEIPPTIDPASRTRIVKLLLPDSSDATAGQFGRAEIPTGTSTPLVVPTTAVGVRGQIEMLHFVADGVHGARIVRTGRHFGDRVEIISGVAEGEMVASSFKAVVAQSSKSTP